MRGKIATLLCAATGSLLVPSLALARGASELVVVADTRVISSGVLKYFANLYNFDPVLFAVWCVVLTAGYGCFLGVFMDFLMSHVGIDLKSRKIVEQ
jgi:hypothetical protein